LNTTRRGFFAALPAPLAASFGIAALARPESPHDAIRSAVREYEAALVEERRVRALYPTFPEDEADRAWIAAMHKVMPTVYPEGWPEDVRRRHEEIVAFENGPLCVAQDAVLATWHRIEDLVRGLGCVALVCNGALYPVMDVEQIEDVFRLNGGLKATQILNLDTKGVAR
jgi:hypothetical protein